MKKLLALMAAFGMMSSVAMANEDHHAAADAAPHADHGHAKKKKAKKAAAETTEAHGEGHEAPAADAHH